MKSSGTFGTQSISKFSLSLLRCAIGLTLGLAALLPQVAQAEDNKLRFFKNYFVTGDYAVAGVGLRGQGINGFASANIDMKTSVPAGADPIAAFLYWQTVETTAKPSSANGFFRGKAIDGRAIGDLNNPGCWSQGGTDGPNSSRGRVYRADVLRYLAIDPIKNVRIANGLHSVKLPDGGGNSNAGAPFANGATLVVVYRTVVPGNPTATPLRSIVIYDGAFSMSKKRDDFTQTLKGFYQASSDSKARLTAIVGNGQPGYSASLAVNGKNFNSNVFVGAQGSRWDNPSFSIKLDPNDSSVDVAVAGDNTGCLTWGAMIVSTDVVDSDRDGLLDVWETSGLHFNPGNATSPATFGGCSNYPSEPCVDLPNMGAVNGQKDLFVEIDWLEDSNHTHKPKLDALLQVAAAFKNGGNGGNGGVRVHFDVGDNYQSSTGTDKIFVPSGLGQGGQLTAQGGEPITESSLRCSISPCTYSVPYSVLSFKKGFSGVRDGYPALNIPRHFSRLRKDIFHYTLFAHALSSPVDPTKPTAPPKTISGVADRPGADLMITLGLWRSDIPANDQVGSTLVQAGTLMHELGHNLGLSHAGNLRTPNCMPNYPSVMNYLYQTRGLTLTSNGNQAIDFSPGTLGDLNENALSETTGLGALKYKIRYYGPRTSLDPPNSDAKVYCDGRTISSGGPMVRLENNFSFIDWNHDGATTPGVLPNDINFSGVIGDGINGTPSFRDSNDWGSLNLQQIGARLNVNGLSTDVGVNDLGVNDLGVNDLGVNDLGVNDLGVNDLGVNDLGVNDLGAIDAGDVDYETAVLSTIDPPPGVSAVNGLDRVTLSWTAPATGSVASYNLYRLTPGNLVPVFIKNVPGGQASGTADDSIGANTQYNVNYTYFVTSVVLRAGLLIESGPSNTANGIIKRVYITAQNAARLYLDNNPTLGSTARGLDAPGPGGVTCTTTATAATFVGTYPIICTGPTVFNSINSIAYIDGELTINPRPQSITFAALANKTIGDPALTVAATATSYLAVIFQAAGNCTIAGVNVTITGVGSCTITAQQPGNINYLAAPSVPQSFTIAPSSTLNVLWYTGGVGTTATPPTTSTTGVTARTFRTAAATGIPFGVTDYQNRITALGAAAATTPATTAPNRPWNIVFWGSGPIPTAPAGGWNVLVVTSTVGPWSPRGDYTALQNAIGGGSVAINPSVNRVMLTGIDADWHYLNSPGSVNFNGPKGFLLNSINWAGSGTGMGLVQMGDGVNFNFGGFTQLLGGSNTVLIPDATIGYAINSGLTGAGLSGWNTSAHSDFQRSFEISGLWMGIHQAAVSDSSSFLTIVSAPFAAGALKP